MAGRPNGRLAEPRDRGTAGRRDGGTAGLMASVLCIVCVLHDHANKAVLTDVALLQRRGYSGGDLSLEGAEHNHCVWLLIWSDMTIYTM